MFDWAAPEVKRLGFPKNDKWPQILAPACSTRWGIADRRPTTKYFRYSLFRIVKVRMTIVNVY